jgi:hypothetical protein
LLTHEWSVGTHDHGTERVSQGNKMKKLGKIVLIIVVNVSILIILFTSYNNYITEKKCNEIGQEFTQFENYCKNEIFDNNVKNNKENYDIFFRYLLENKDELGFKSDSVSIRYETEITFGDVSHLPVKIKAKAIQLWEDCNKLPCELIIYKNGNPQIEIILKKGVKGKYCGLYHKLKWYENGFYQAPIPSVGNRQLIVSNNLVYHVEYNSKVNEPDCQ